MNDLLFESERNNQQLLVYDLCYSNSWINRFTEYLKKEGWVFEYGLIILISLISFDKSIETNEIINYINELSADLFTKKILGNKDLNSFICILPVENNKNEDKDSIEEKCCALYERLTTIINTSIRIGIGGIKRNIDLRESMNEAESCLKQSDFSIISYSDYRKDSDKNRRGTISLFFDYLSVNYSRQISLESVSKELGVSPNYLSCILKKQTNKSYINHLTEYRINRAKDLLINSRLTAKSIGIRVGYPDSIYFSRVFKKQTGMTPVEFRINN